MGHSSSEMSDRYTHVALETVTPMLPWKKPLQQSISFRPVGMRGNPTWKDFAPLPIEEAPTATR